MLKKPTKSQRRAVLTMGNLSTVDGGQSGLEHQLVSITPTTQEQKVMRPFSNSRLVAMNQCPTWGVVSAQKRYPTTARSMALEAGALMHEVFAAVRIWQLHHLQHLPQHALSVAYRLFEQKTEPNYFNQKFDSNRWTECWKATLKVKDKREQLMILAYHILRSGGWEDSPTDDVRTINSMEIAATVYVTEMLRKMENFPIYVADEGDPRSIVGIENVFDVVLTYADGKQYRYIGTLDGLTYDLSNKRYCLEDNKTASRLDTGWKASFELSHQISGYLACAAIVYGFPMYHSRILGLKLKPSSRGEDFWPAHFGRTAEQLRKWAEWFRHTAQMFEQYEYNFEQAPRYTHSCNRYFRPCSLLSFCGDTFEGRIEQWEQMVSAKATPSEMAIED